MCCYANLCYDECNIVVWWIWPARCRPTETKPDETRYYQMQSGRICPMVSLSAHRGLMPVSPFPVNIMNDMMFTVFIYDVHDVHLSCSKYFEIQSKYFEIQSELKQIQQDLLPPLPRL